MNIGLYISASQNASYHDAIEQVALADQLGFHSAWLTEKHFEQGNLLWSSPLVAASYIAAKTRQIKIGFAACVSTLHHPVRLAEDFANLDVLSHGRIIIGLTRTSLSEYYHEVFQSPLKKAWKKFDEQFEIMQKLWQGQLTKHSGAFYKMPALKLYPPFVQQPLPPIFLLPPAMIQLSTLPGRVSAFFCMLSRVLPLSKSKRNYMKKILKICWA